MGTAFAFLLSRGGMLTMAVLGLAGALTLYALYAFFTGAVPMGIAVLAGAAVLIAILQAGLQGNWFALLPTMSLIVIAGSVSYGTFLISSGAVVMTARNSGEATQGENSERTAEWSTDEEDPAFVTGAQVEAAWVALEAGRQDYAPEPEQSAVTVLLKAGESFERRDLSFLTLAGLEMHASPDEEDDATGLDMTGAILHGGRLACADFESARLGNAVFEFPLSLKAALDKTARYTDARYVNFRHAEFDGARMGDTDFSYANFENANFGRADLTKAVLDFANLAGASLERTSGLTPAQLSKACLSSQTQVPDALNLPDGEQWGSECEALWGDAEERGAVTHVFARHGEGKPGHCPVAGEGGHP